jgi:arylsulfatase A-like enzyme
MKPPRYAHPRCSSRSRCCSPDAKSSTRRPTWSWSWSTRCARIVLGTYGYTRPTSPAIDAFAKDSLVFDRAYANAPWTLPSFASILTGLLPHDHKVGRDPVRVSTYGRVENDLETLAELAKSQGYRTAAYVNNSYLAREFGFQQGFDVYDWVGASDDGVPLRSRHRGPGARVAHDRRRELAARARLRADPLHGAAHGLRREREAPRNVRADDQPAGARSVRSRRTSGDPG